MRQAALLGAAVIAGATIALFVQPDAEERPVAPTSTVAPPAAAGSPTVPQAALDPGKPSEAPPRVALHGVVIRGSEGAESKALLSVDGQPEQPYGIGEAIARGWSVHAVQPDRVVLARGAQRASFELVARAASAEAAPEVVPRPAASAPQLPGFVASPRPAVPDGSAQERNRRFLDAVQRGPPASPARQPVP